MADAYKCFVCGGCNLYHYFLEQIIPDTNEKVRLSTLRCKDCLVEAPIGTWATACFKQDRAPVQDWHQKATQWLLKKIADDKARSATGKPGSGLDERTLRYLINELNAAASKHWRR